MLNITKNGEPSCHWCNEKAIRMIIYRKSATLVCTFHEASALRGEDIVREPKPVFFRYG